MSALGAPKPGTEGIDREKIASQIEELTRGTKFWLYQQKKKKALESKVELLRPRLEFATSSNTVEAVNAACQSIEKLMGCLWNRFLHVDMDAFYANVECLENPHLNVVPMAVGSAAMISTANYHARKFGVSSGMPGYLGKKLCPQLVLVPHHFDRYQHYSEIVMSILREFDGTLQSISLDEASIDLKKYHSITGRTAEDVAAEIMKRVPIETGGLTCSIGIACSRSLAKISSNQRKPSGVFILGSDRKAVLDFLEKLPVRKLFGIGNVTETILSELLEIKTCRDVWNEKYRVFAVFQSMSIIEWSLGYDDSVLSNPGESEAARKSISAERSFTPTDDVDWLSRLLWELSESISNGLTCENLLARTATLKVRTDDYEIHNRSATPNDFASQWSTESLYQCALALLKNEEWGIIRLLGVRLSNLSEKSEEPENLCPICYRVKLPLDCIAQNQHIDDCLSMAEVRSLLNLAPVQQRKAYHQQSLDSFVKIVQDHDAPN